MADNRQAITLSEHLGATAEKLEQIGVLNTNLGIDLKLFIDPKLVRSSSIPELSSAASIISRYFDQLLKINAQAHLSSRLASMALSMIAIKEPKGLAIGYGDRRDTGTSISLSVAKDSLRSLNEMLGVGYRDITVMEMLGLFIKRFGADSISDLVSHIIYDNLCAYTQRLCKENGFAVSEFTIAGKQYLLPKHPFKGTQVIFVPLEVVSELPIATSWDDIAAAAAINANVRDNFNDMVSGNLKQYAKKVKNDPALLMQSAANMTILVKTYSDAKVKPYDTATDPLGYIRVNAYSDEISGTVDPVRQQFQNIGGVQQLISETIVPQYRRHIEQLGANKLLYKRVGSNLRSVDETAPVHEDAAQVLFHIIADQVCRESNVMIARESTTAPGAVDFSLGKGYQEKIVVEIKKSTNKNLLDGYEKQIVAYEEAEAAAGSAYVVVIVRASNQTNPDSQLNQLIHLNAEKIRNGNKAPELHIINGLIKDSASKR
jgi:hypothetical protein